MNQFRAPSHPAEPKNPYEISTDHRHGPLRDDLHGSTSRGWRASLPLLSRPRSLLRAPSPRLPALQTLPPCGVSEQLLSAFVLPELLPPGILLRLRLLRTTLPELLPSTDLALVRFLTSGPLDSPHGALETAPRFFMPWRQRNFGGSPRARRRSSCLRPRLRSS